MEINLVQENNDNGDLHKEASPEQSVSAENSDTCVAFGDPEVLPRVGEEYQVEVPPLMKKLDYVSVASIKHDKEVHNDFCIGLAIAIPVMWINKEDETVKQESLKHEIFADDDLRENISGPELTQNELVLEQEFDVKRCGNMVPGSSSESWSYMEEESFLLSLYIFGKNLVQVKKFMKGRKMGDVLSFYYGKFYRSEKHRRWSECRKVRGRRCVYGQRLFTGWRQHELLSRLFSHGSEERKSALLEVSKKFTESKIRFEEYVFALRAIVGLKDLIDAVGIGKGKQDLSGCAMDPLKSSQAASIRPEIPSGKACSALTPSEIVQFLTGDFRLSKARTSDLFWEAVWPRLLARGWHSEQPTNHGFAIGTKQSLVFLIPGIKKFLGGKLVKGNHYFDSVSDVLSKVASNPWMLELENGSVRAGENAEENRWAQEMKKDKEDVLNQHRHCYLQPRTPNHDSDATKFTVVDTSLACGKSFKIRELRSLPAEIMRNSSGRSRSDSKDSNSVSSENSIDKLNFDENNDKITISLERKDFSGGGSKQRPQSSSRRTRPDVKNKAKKRSRQGLNVCDQSETSQKLKQEAATCSTDSFYYSENSHCQVDQLHEKSSSNSSIREHAQDTSHPRELIDLNVPITLDGEIDELSLVGNGDGHGRTNQVLLCPNTIKTTQNHQNLRRQSTRNRPPTTRALEALALGFLDVKQKRKAKDTFQEEHLMLGRSRRARAKVRSSENSRSITEDSKTEEAENSISNSNCESTFAAKVQSLVN